MNCFVIGYIEPRRLTSAGKRSSPSSLNLYTDVDFDVYSSDKGGYSGDSQWNFGLLERRDMDDAVRLSMESFFRPRLTVSDAAEESMSPTERSLLRGVIGTFTTFEQYDARFSNFIGYTSRAGSRLDHPCLTPSADSVILAAVDRASGDLAGMVEISLEPANGRLGPPVKSPFRGQPESTYEPYLCNLCVAQSKRRRGLAKRLCWLCEDVVREVWRKDVIYLHVESSNVPAQELYVGHGYRLAPSPLSAWELKMMGMENVLYYKKALGSAHEQKKGTQAQLDNAEAEAEAEMLEESVLGVTRKDLRIASNTMRGTKRFG